MMSGDADPDALRPPGRRWDRPQPVRAARAPGAPLGRGSRRPAAAARDRARSDDHLHDHDRRHLEGRRRRRPRVRSAARRRRRGAPGIRGDPACPVAGPAPGGPACLPLAPRPPDAGRRVRVGARRRRSPRLRLHAVRGADPRGGDHGRRGKRPLGCRRTLLRRRFGSRPARPVARRSPRDRPSAGGRAGATGPADARRRDGPHGRRDRHAARRQARPADRRAHPPGQPDRVARGQPRRDRPDRVVPARGDVPLHVAGRAGRQPGADPPGSRAGPGLHGDRAVVQHAGRRAADAGRAAREGSC